MPSQQFLFLLLGLFFIYDFLTLDFLALDKDVEEIGTPAVSKALDLNPADTRGVTPLLEAIEADSIKNVRLLISIDGVDLNAKDKEGVCYFLTTLPFTTPHYGIAWML